MAGKASLADVFVAGLPARLSAIDAGWEQLQRYWDAEALTDLHRLVHNLHGTSATLGFDTISAAARGLEHAFGALDQRVVPNEQQRALIERLLVELKQALHTQDEPPRTPAPVPVADTDVVVANRLIWLEQLDPVLVADLTTQLGYFGYQVQAYESLPDPRAQAGRSVPSAIITSADILEAQRGSYEPITNGRAAQNQAPPLIVISNQGDLESRLRAARAGAAAYFVSPVTTVALIDKLDALTARSVEEPYRILIVDDDP
ncbi:MAG: Hpt domain-containing protein, partial [Roseiflexaceae bacterium]